MNTENTKPSPNTKSTTDDLMNDPRVVDAIVFINKHLVTFSKHDLSSKYLIGQKVQEIRASASNDKYGKKVVSTIAKSVGVSPACLYQYGDVARTWDKATFDEAGLRAARVRLTFSHFIELAHEDHAPHREQLLEEAIKNRLSVRDLRGRRPELEQEASPAPSGVQLAEETEKSIDILNRLAAEGPTAEIREAIDAELEELHQRAAELQRRVEQLAAARAMCAAAPAATEAGTDCGKAAE